MTYHLRPIEQAEGRHSVTPAVPSGNEGTFHSQNPPKCVQVGEKTFDLHLLKQTAQSK